MPSRPAALNCTRRARRPQVALGGCVTTPPRTIRCRSRSTTWTGARSVMSASRGGWTLVDMSQRIDALQAEVRRLRGQVEVLENPTRRCASSSAISTATCRDDSRPRAASVPARRALPAPWAERAWVPPPRRRVQVRPRRRRDPPIRRRRYGCAFDAPGVQTTPCGDHGDARIPRGLSGPRPAGQRAVLAGRGRTT